jgi:hypothetical protein
MESTAAELRTYAAILGTLMVILGVLITSFFTLPWRRLDSIDKTLIIVQTDLKQFYGAEQKIEGRVDDLSKRVK